MICQERTLGKNIGKVRRRAGSKEKEGKKVVSVPNVRG